MQILQIWIHLVIQNNLNFSTESYQVHCDRLEFCKCSDFVFIENKCCLLTWGRQALHSFEESPSVYKSKSLGVVTSYSLSLHFRQRAVSSHTISFQDRHCVYFSMQYKSLCALPVLPQGIFKGHRAGISTTAELLLFHQKHS